MTTDQLHDLMEKICGHNLVGAAFSIKSLTTKVQDDLKNAAPMAAKLSYPTTLPHIYAGLSITPSSVVFQKTARGVFQLKAFSYTIVLYEPQKNGINGRRYNAIDVVFDTVDLKLAPSAIDPSVLRFSLASGNPGLQPKPGSPDLSVIKDNKMTLDEYQRYEAAILASSGPLSVLEQFIDSIPLPPVIGSMEVFGIDQPYSFTFTSEYVVVAGPPKILGPNACGAASGTSSSTTITGNAQTSSAPNGPNGITMAVNHQAVPIRPSTWVPTNDAAYAFYFPKSKTFDILANQTVGPAVSASDSGRVVLFDWAWQAVARPEYVVATIATVQQTLEIDAPLDVAGVAEVSMKIGCVTVPILSSSLVGFVKPSKYTLTFSLVPDGNSGSEVIAVASYANSVDIHFHSPPVVDLLLNAFLGSIGDKLISRRLVTLADRLNVKLLKLQSLALLKPSWVWGLARNLRTDSLLIAVDQHYDAKSGERRAGSSG